MDLLILDSNLQPLAVLDSYNSLIWTDRYCEYGDFEIYTRMSTDLLSFIKQGNYVSRKDSEHIMIIEKILISSDSEDGDYLTVTGRSLESILDRRIIWGLKILSGTFQNGVKTLLNECMISPSNPDRKIDNFIFEESTDPEITRLALNAQYTGDNLYEAIVAMCSERGIGFKVTLNENNQFVFKLYNGADRSYEQTDNTYVVFSPNFDNLISSNYVESKASWKNVTLVGGEDQGSNRRYTAVGNTAGLERREYFTDARDISSDDEEEFTPEFVFTQFPNQVFDEATKTFIKDEYFDSAMADLSRCAGRTISITIPSYTKTGGAASGYSTIIVDSNKKHIATLKVWDKYEGAENYGSLDTYEIVLPENVSYIYTSVYNQKALDNHIYHGSVHDFSCSTIKISSEEYINLLRQRGKEKLNENPEILSFEGEAETMNMFRYGVDFFNGDIVQVEDGYGHETRARILEIVTSDSSSGYSVYPTFSMIQSRLPIGYTELAYIESTGTQYIDTAYRPSTDTRLVMDISDLSVIDSVLAGSRDEVKETASSAYTVILKPSGGVSYLRSDYFGSTASIAPTNYSVRTTIDKDRTSFTAYDLNVSNAEASYKRSQYSIYLFALNNVGAVWHFSKYRLYSCQIYNNGSLIRDFIPCKNEKGQIGLYDTIDQTFYQNLGTGEFIAGEKGSENSSIDNDFNYPNYNDAINKPSINGVTLEGNKTNEEIHIRSIPEIEIAEVISGLE